VAVAAILIVEDQPLHRKLLSAVLRWGGHTVSEAGDGADALHTLREHPPDLVISDILMPSMDGYELVRRMREEPSLLNTPVIFYSATYHEREAEALARRCGVSTILMKPSAPRTILTAVQQALGSAPLARTEPDSAFDREHLHLVNTTLAEKIGALEIGEQRLAAIVDFAQQLMAEHDPDALLRHACAAARDVTLAQHAVLGVLDVAEAATVALFTSGLDNQSASMLIPPSVKGSPLENVVRQRRPSRLADTTGLRDFLRPHGSAAYSLLAVPLATPTHVHGWLVLRNKLGAHQFSDHDEQTVFAMATHAALAYENARLLADVGRHAAALEEAQENTRFAHIAARMGVWEWDTTSDRIVWPDETALAFGLTPEQAPHTMHAFFDLVHPDDRRSLREATARAMRERIDLIAEFRTVAPDGTIRWIGTHGRFKFAETGESTRLLGLNVDVTDRKLLELQFHQAQKMEAVGQLAGGIAHDFNNMLTAVLGNANLILEDVPSGSAVAHGVEEIIAAAERAAGLTRQLLAFGRKQVLQTTTVDLNVLVADMSQMLRRLIGEHIQLSTTPGPGLSPVRADRTQLEQVVMNLVVNARDAMPMGGRLSILTSDVDLDEAYKEHHIAIPAGRYVMLSVSDSGTGMDEETKKHLFEPFFTTKDRGKGTGLGLATVYGIVKQSGGYIWVYSELGHGTTFKIHLPVAGRIAAIERLAEPALHPSRGSELLLLVEDEKAVRHLAKAMLERAGYRVLSAANAQEAAEQFQQHAEQIDLVVTDIVMPGASGPALFDALMKRRPGLKVLYMSGYANDAVPGQPRMDAHAVFLQKPFTSDRLIRKVREALEINPLAAGSV
jgi:PAS domain S-box-containing protein